MIGKLCDRGSGHDSRARRPGVHLAAALGLLLSGLLAAAAATVPVSDFGGTGLDDWEERDFDGRTRYAIVSTERGAALDARSDSAGSGLFRELDIELGDTPRLAWSWWIDRAVPVDDVREKPGDDFAARVYVVFDGGMAFWRTTTLVYVWADADAPTGFWNNPFTDQARVLALRRGGGGRWTDESRDVAADYRAAFGRSPPDVVAVAVMTDTDQTGGTAHARYADLRFTTSPPPAP